MHLIKELICWPEIAVTCLLELGQLRANYRFFISYHPKCSRNNRADLFIPRVLLQGDQACHDSWQSVLLVEFITHRYNLEDVEKAFETVLAGEAINLVYTQGCL